MCNCVQTYLACPVGDHCAEGELFCFDHRSCVRALHLLTACDTFEKARAPWSTHSSARMCSGQCMYTHPGHLLLLGCFQARRSRLRAPEG
jgi:hypothetical protein